MHFKREVANLISEKATKGFILDEFFRKLLVKPLIVAYSDTVEKHREMAIEITKTTLEAIGLKDEAQLILPAVIGRLNDNNPFPEPTEEVRLQLIDLLDVCLTSDKYQFMQKLPEMGHMLSKVLLDPNPDMKKEGAQFAGRFCETLDKAGSHMKATIISLVHNLQHQHN